MEKLPVMQYYPSRPINVDGILVELMYFYDLSYFVSL